MAGHLSLTSCLFEQGLEKAPVNCTIVYFLPYRNKKRITRKMLMIIHFNTPFLGEGLYKMVYLKPTLRDTFFKRQGKKIRRSNLQVYQLYPKWHPARASRLVHFDRKIVCCMLYSYLALTSHYFGQGSRQNLF